MKCLMETLVCNHNAVGSSAVSSDTTDVPNLTLLIAKEQWSYVPFPQGYLGVYGNW